MCKIKIEITLKNKDVPDVMVFNKKRAAEEKKLKEQIELDQNKVLDWLKAFFPEYSLKLTFPAVEISYETRMKHFGHYALDNIEQSKLMAMEKLQQGKITQEEFEQRKVELAEKTKQLNIVEPMHAAYLTNNTIVYYINNIRTTAKQQEYSVDEFLIRITVHEMFHAVHCFLCGNEHWVEKNCPREWSVTVKESLARYIEYVFSTENNLSVHAEAIRNDLLDSYKCAPSYPYAGAKNLILDKKVDFREILKLSLEDWKIAYRLLV